MNILSKFRSKKPEPTKAPEKAPEKPTGPRTKTLVLNTYQYVIDTGTRTFRIVCSDTPMVDIYPLGVTTIHDLHIYQENSPINSDFIQIDEERIIPFHAVQLIKRKIIHQEKITYDLDKIKEGCSPEEAIIKSETIDPTDTE